MVIGHSVTRLCSIEVQPLVPRTRVGLTAAAVASHVTSLVALEAESLLHALGAGGTVAVTGGRALVGVAVVVVTISTPASAA